MKYYCNKDLIGPISGLLRYKKGNVYTYDPRTLYMSPCEDIRKTMGNGLKVTDLNWYKHFKKIYSFIPLSYYKLLNVTKNYK